jgi:hypothetical protein
LEGTGSWRKCEEFHNFYSSPHIIRMTKSRMRWVTNKTGMGEKRNAYTILAGIPDGKRPSGIPRHRCKDNIKIYFKEMGWKSASRSHLAQDRDKWRVL